MSTTEDRARLLAERVARRIRSNEPQPRTSHELKRGPSLGSELAAVRVSLHELERRLERIEASLPEEKILSGSAAKTLSRSEYSNGGSENDRRPRFAHSPWMREPQEPDHPSQEKFGIEEAAVSELVDYFESEKKCELEPGGKPCDHCAMCSSRGF